MYALPMFSDYALLHFLWYKVKDILLSVMYVISISQPIIVIYWYLLPYIVLFIWMSSNLSVSVLNSEGFISCLESLCHSQDYERYSSVFFSDTFIITFIVLFNSLICLKYIFMEHIWDSFFFFLTYSQSVVLTPHFPVI